MTGSYARKSPDSSVETCVDCGGPLAHEGNFCPHCGTPTEAEDLPRAGELVGRYRVARRIGRGGMAAVYQARDEELGRQVALKVLTADEFDAEEARARFRREAQITSNFNHPNAVTVYDYLVTESGYPCLVLELILGVPVSASLQAGPFAPHRAVAIANEVLDVLGEAAARDLVHRDITASNILLVGPPDRERVKLLDFGIAKPVAAMPTGPLTVAGQVVGSPTYMSPEQCRGEELDGRSDLYSLGIVLYEMLVGAVPFEGDSHVEILRRQIHDAPPPLPSRIDRALAAVVEKALAKDVADRYADAAEFREALAGALPQGEAHGSAPTPDRFLLEPEDGSEPITLGESQVLGRGNDVDVLISGPGSELVSATHAAIVVEGDRVSVRDLGSTNGTYVNGRRVHAAELVEGSLLRLAASGPGYRVRVPAPSAGQDPSGESAEAAGDHEVPRPASGFRRWLGLSTD